MELQPKRTVSPSSLVLAYSAGLALCLLTQVGVILQHGPKIYVSLLWAPLYPVQQFIAEVSGRAAVALGVPVRDATARGIGVVLSSVLLGLISPAIFAVVRSSNRAVRYLGIAILVVFLLSAILWGPFPNF
jgi:hypothetical protein